jgi:arginine/serine-rich splicing factor 4/5/6
MTRSSSYHHHNSKSLNRKKYKNLNSRIYISNMSNKIKKKELKERFNKYGPIKKISIKEGFGFVEYDNSKDAKHAIEKEDHTSFQGKCIIVKYFDEFERKNYSNSPRSYRRSYSNDHYSRSQSRIYSRSRSRSYERKYESHSRSYSRKNTRTGRRGDWRIRVENMNEATSWQDLKDFARGAGPSVTFTKVWREDGQNFGLMEYLDERDFESALDKLDSCRLDGNKIRLVAEGNSRHNHRSCSQNYHYSLSESHRFSNSKSRRHSSIESHRSSISKSRQYSSSKIQKQNNNHTTEKKIVSCSRSITN